MKIKAKVLKYDIMYHGIFGGIAKVKLLDGPEKGEVFEIQVVSHCKKGDVIELNRTEEGFRKKMDDDAWETIRNAGV